MNAISRYSGKCDLYDSLIEIHNYTLEELQNNVKIYVGNSSEPLHIEKMSDMIQYYPYIIGSACFNNTERKSVVYLSSKSWVDIEEQDCLKWRLEHLIRIYNRCKRKKIEFNVEEALKEIVWGNWNIEPYRELANRVKEYGKKATIDGIHLRMHELYRKELAEEMIKNGLDPRDYGYGRFVEKEVQDD